jgi:hypothetical protein
MKKLIYLLTLLPMIVCAEQARDLTPDGGPSGKATAAVGEADGSSETLSVYKRAGDWRHFAELVEATIKRHPPTYGQHAFAEAVGVGMGDDSWALNSLAWDVFKQCDDKTVLTNGLGWSELSILIALPKTHSKTESYPIQQLDTKANLLYKLGRVDEAIASEQEAIAQDSADAKKAGKEKGYWFDEYSATVVKMGKGEPTWPQTGVRP